MPLDENTRSNSPYRKKQRPINTANAFHIAAYPMALTYSPCDKQCYLPSRTTHHPFFFPLLTSPNTAVVAPVPNARPARRGPPRSTGPTAVRGSTAPRELRPELPTLAQRAPSRTALISPLRLSAILAPWGFGVEASAQTRRMGRARLATTVRCQPARLPTSLALWGHSPIQRRYISRVSARIAHRGELMFARDL